jgi:hypothetical protein
MLACPYCQQDFIWEVSVRDVDGPLYMCAECDTVWSAFQDVRCGQGQIFEEFMAQRGLVADWKAITKIKQVEDR